LIKNESRKIKKLSKAEELQYKQIKAELRIKYANKTITKQKTKMNDYLIEKRQKTANVFSDENFDAYKKKKKLTKKLLAQQSILNKLDRINLCYSIGYMDADKIYFAYFLDYRGRIYSTG